MERGVQGAFDASDQAAKISFFNLQAGCLAVRVQVSPIDHDAVARLLCHNVRGLSDRGRTKAFPPKINLQIDGDR